MNKQTCRRAASALLVLILCLSMAGLFVMPAKADYASGDWKKVNINGHTYWAWEFSSAAKNCTSFEVSFDVSLNANAKCKNWSVWVRSGGSFTKVDSLYLAEGSGYIEQTIYLSPARTIDAVAVTPTASGSYTYEFSLGIYNIEASTPVTVDTYGSESSGSSGNRTDANTLSGSWEKISVDSMNVYALMFDEQQSRVKRFSVDVEVELLNGAYCEDWNVWTIKDRDYTKVDSLYIPRNSGTATKTITFKNGQTFDGIAITPVKRGSYSWYMDFYVYDVE